KTISQLRFQTGAGVGECSQALKEANGDIDRAIEVLRKKGSAKAAKKAERATKEGIIAIKVADDHQSGSLAAINCETDFVAKNSDFIAFVNNLIQGANPEEEFKAKKEELILKIGENLTFGIAQTLKGAYVAGYLHANKKLAALVSFNKEVLPELAYDIAMHITASNPLYLQPADVPTAETDKEKEIYREQLKAENKPEAIREKIIAGKLEKYYEEVCLLNQRFIKDDSLTIQQLLSKIGQDIKIEKFVRHQI
ncbi:MAG: translation elongation factor Ts, partial [bacterium]